MTYPLSVKRAAPTISPNGVNESTPNVPLMLTSGDASTVHFARLMSANASGLVPGEESQAASAALTANANNGLSLIGDQLGAG